MRSIIAFLPLLFLLLITCCKVELTINSNAGFVAGPAARYIDQHKRAIDIANYKAFVQNMEVPFQNMAACKVVGLGEGTHGTSEFQTVRTYITRYLIEQKGFNTVCLENSYGWCVALNQYIQSGKGNLDTIMRTNLLGMWHNEEIKALLVWMRDYNQNHAKKIQLTGMDYSCILPNANIISSISGSLNNVRLDTLINKLITYCSFMDNAYADLNEGGKKYKWADILQNGVNGYELVQQIKSELNTKDLQSTFLHDNLVLLNTSLYNCELCFYSIYKPVKQKKESSRDQNMADMIKLFADNNADARIIVWAHQAHLSRKSIFNDNNGGGAGSYIEAYFPHQYFVLGTGTAAGTLSATTDAIILNSSRFASYALPMAADSSWEQKIMKLDKRNVYLDCTDKNSELPKLKLRFTGYGPAKKQDFVGVRMNELFDGFIFIRNSHATRRM